MARTEARIKAILYELIKKKYELKPVFIRLSALIRDELKPQMNEVELWPYELD